VIDLEVREGVAWLTINRQDKLNALNLVAVQEMGDQLRSIRQRDDVRVVVTRGAGRAYCAGSDITELAPLSPAEATSAEREHGDVFALLDEIPQPTIAMLHGYVLGGGLGLAIYHDFRVAAESSIFGMPEVELGWTPPWAVGRLVDTVGGAHARWLIMACERLNAANAKLIGLVNEVVADNELENYVQVFAKKLATLPTEGLCRSKRLINQMSPMRRPEWDAQAAVEFEACYHTSDAKNLIEKFLLRGKS
jgi:enoyl-CoA hydratase/carnithine racemase